MKTYGDLIHALQRNSLTVMYVAVFFQKENLQWMPVDIVSYIEAYGQLRDQPLPCMVEQDGNEIFMHTNVEL